MYLIESLFRRRRLLGHPLQAEDDGGGLAPDVVGGLAHGGHRPRGGAGHDEEQHPRVVHVRRLDRDLRLGRDGWAIQFNDWFQKLDKNVTMDC